MRSYGSLGREPSIPPHGRGTSRLIAAAAIGSLFVAVAMAVASGVSRGIGPIAARSLDGRGGRSYYDDDVPRGDEDRRGIYTSFGRIQLGLQASTEPGAELDYWPGLKLEDVVPNSEEERADLPSVDWIGNGYGIYVSNGRAGVQKGFFGSCEVSANCSNYDICVRGRCMAPVHNGSRAACDRVSPGSPGCELLAPNQVAADVAGDAGNTKGGAATASVRSRQQQLMVNMAYLHHEMGRPEGGGGLGGDDGSLPALSRGDGEVEAREEATGSVWQDPVSGEWDNDHAVGGRGGFVGRRQQLAQEGGSGTSLDFTFGVGKDGEAPMRIQGEAYSVSTGSQDPNAPPVLPYAKMGGSGTDGRLAVVGYFTQ